MNWVAILAVIAVLGVLVFFFKKGGGCCGGGSKSGSSERDSEGKCCGH